MWKIWIILTEELRNVYLDEGNNPIFNDWFLEEVTQERNSEAGDNEMSEILRKVLKDKEEKNISKIADKFIIEKFTNGKAGQWMQVSGWRNSKKNVIDLI